jgi:hypothetical protein
MEEQWFDVTTLEDWANGVRRERDINSGRERVDGVVLGTDVVREKPETGDPLSPIP